MNVNPGRRAAGCLLAGALTLAAGNAQAAATILLWPIDPWLDEATKATELWIQNQGETPTTMQVRIVRWTQEGGLERYQQQGDVVASPPIVQIAPDSKQLIRLIKQAAIPAGKEQAYRIIVDEIPQPDDPNKPKIGLKLQMRYSIPLFVYGQGVKTEREGAHHVFVQPAKLHWRVVREGGQAQLEVRNDDSIHVRLSKVRVRQGGQMRQVAEGLLGYVLPHSARRWPLPAGASNPSALEASINARDEQWQSSAGN
ncbi:molecular chaperone [Kosakonia sp. SMBL-WEM22]|uniref:fimbrial biogenesis chaperone n=1 Tax=Kosakonia sp. SMBL-WEM22 TaxID=2725560 RepID=UPI001659F109|nr:molecular chaperone [Kosakonia sp. SMBL-WEM22]QNQ20804.1 molecular chaperone [Kosakonia sp. SMBL-WEM22]